MLGKTVVSCLLAMSFCVTGAMAADVKEKYSVQEALAVEKVKNAVAGDVSFYWGDQKHPKVVKNFGSFKTSKRTNGFAKSRVSACNWAMASALKALKERADKEGGNAVINIVSNIQDHEESSSSQYSCLAGRMMVNVALKGTVVTVKK